MRRLVAFGALAVALAACGSPRPATDRTSLAVAPSSGSESAPAAASAPPTSAAAAAPTPTRCDAGVLAARVEPGDAGAGNRYGKLVVTNNGSAPCTLNGYSGLQLLDGAGNPLPTNLQRTTDPGPQPVTLAPGATAAANLRWTVVPTGDEPVEKPCQPDAVSAAAIPPDETRPMSLPWGLGPVCAGGKIEISAFYPA